MLFSRPGWLVVSAMFFLLLPAFSDSEQILYTIVRLNSGNTASEELGRKRFML